MKSMTAFARAEKTEKEINVLAEIRSYNSRYLDVALRIPHGYAALEEKIKSLIADKVSRGRIEVNLQINDDSDEAYAFEVNISRARAYYESLVQLKDQLDLNSEISIELLLREGGVVRPAESGRDMVAIGSVVTDCINAAMIDLVAMRQKEGDFIASDISRRIDSIEKSIRQIEKESRDLLFYYQQRLKDRIAVLTKGMVEIDSDRIAQEAAFLADKIDISEEIVRVTSHIKQFLTIMGSKEPAGRKLNFLLQELNREFNTMGSKTEKASVSHRVVEVKSELEKIREQLQNVE
ncbi:MAG: YicC family protein [Deltaproteobacteria bacterium]|nr:YicC family protein [Deltaproteobacteria bacterium]MBW2555423.1 YicC family protein [Deltaproteobacteria bacterium]